MAEQTGSRRACDRCHMVKERCRWTHGLGKCERCQRLHSPCQTRRPTKSRGRKSRYALPQARRPLPASSEGSDITPVDLIIAGSEPSKLPRTLSVFFDLNDRELQILHGVPEGKTRVDQYLVGPSFHECHLKTFIRHLGIALPFLRDALLASSALIAYEYQPRPIQLDRMIGHKRAASAISSLRSLASFDPGSVSTVLILAILSISFAEIISGRSLEICRHSLHLVKPLYDSLITLDPDSLAFVGCLISSELEECLFRCEVPTLRFRVQELEPKVDRFLGVSTPLLPYLHDIAVISHRLRHDTGSDRPQIMKALDALETEVGQWKPELPESHEATHSQAEIISILTQANVTRWSILLMAHRLRHPYGTETIKAGAISEIILEDLSLSVQRTGRSVPGVNLAFLAACFELTGPGERQSGLEKTQLFVEFSKQVQGKVKTILMAAWTILDTHDQLYWHDLCALLPQ
ncbi:hypothetical protein BCR34DRAFT_492860 [Clohesyomyces aquaticus]|uniref:Zn(2)-C6 fungal-type domain-containing protein n=1 Tax=Clohesyomyces aquaticus TaxID=1231657 RepID=A0A1Y1YXT6_9PLEO|nr:hypothetical protein BCR34DRAFT_492860 [Clohesyomyces aquaticus]